MRTATKTETSIWKLREEGLSYAQIAQRAKVSKSVVAGALSRIRHGTVTLPVVNRDRGGCRWVNGDPLKDWSWCDTPVTGESAWCVEHHRRVYPRHSL